MLDKMREDKTRYGWTRKDKTRYQDSQPPRQAPRRVKNKKTHKSKTTSKCPPNYTNQNIHKAATRNTFIRPAALCSLQCSINYTRANNNCTCVNMTKTNCTCVNMTKKMNNRLKSSCKNEAALLGTHSYAHCFF
jgi:hypothetical protein